MMNNPRKIETVVKENLIAKSMLIRVFPLVLPYIYNPTVLGESMTGLKYYPKTTLSMENVAPIN